MDVSKWIDFRLGKVFRIEKGKRLTDDKAAGRRRERAAGLYIYGRLY